MCSSLKSLEAFRSAAIESQNISMKLIQDLNKSAKDLLRINECAAELALNHLSRNELTKIR